MHMKKALFIVYHGFSDHSGISKKIRYQCEALRRCGVQTGLCHLEIAPDGTQRRIVDTEPIREFGNGHAAKVLKRISMGDIADYVRKEAIEFVYIRHDFNANPTTIRLLKQLKRLGVRVALEIPTYPYDSEFAGTPLSWRFGLCIDQLFRRWMCRYVDRIVTFSDETEIFGRPTIRISNGIDFDSVPVKGRHSDVPHELRLLAVANIHFWHGFDRVIEGLRAYYAAPHDGVIRLRIAGDGHQATIDDLEQRIENYGLEEYVEVIGTRSGEKLDAEFEWCDMGIASLGRHRNGISTIKTLKNREYAARGIPFVYSETDSDFDTQPYVLKAPADESPLDMEALMRFYDSMHLTPSEIRASIEQTLSWQRQMEQVVEAIEQLPDSQKP